MMVVVEVTMVGRGVPRCGRAICLPRATKAPTVDPESVRSLLYCLKRSAPDALGNDDVDNDSASDDADDEEESDTAGVSSLSQTPRKKVHTGGASRAQDGDKQDNEKSSRSNSENGYSASSIIGYVTSGTFSHIRGRGFGVGLCSLSGLQRALAGQAVSNIKADGGTGPFGVLLEGRLNVDVVALNPRNSHKSKKESKKTNQATGMAAGGGGSDAGGTAVGHIQRYSAVLRVRLS